MDKLKKRKLLELLAAAICSIICIKTIFAKKVNFDNFDLGNETSSYLATVNNKPIHLTRLITEDCNAMQTGWAERGKKNVVFILGNSQTHSINFYQQGQSTFPEILTTKPELKAFDVLTHSIPNANLQQFYLSFEYFKTKYPIKKVIVPICPDDLRENNLNLTNFFKALVDDKFILNDKNELALDINKSLTKLENEGNTTIDTNKLHKKVAVSNQTTQEIVEQYLNESLDKKFDFWRDRENIRGDYFVFLYKLRNTLLRINSQTPRSIGKDLAEKNIAALAQLIESAKKDNTELYLYIPPLRVDIATPYIAKEYTSYVEEIKNLAKENSKVYFKQIDSIIPGNLWGYKAATDYITKKDYDFMHFKALGHKIVADSITNFLTNNK